MLFTITINQICIFIYDKETLIFLPKLDDTFSINQQEMFYIWIAAKIYDAGRAFMASNNLLNLLSIFL